MTDNGLPVLTDGEIVLRQVRRQDAEDMLELLRQPSVARWWGAYDTAKLERDFFDQAWAYTYLVLVDGQLAGMVQFHEEPDPDYQYAAVDITLGEAFQDRGLGTRTLKLLLRYLIEGRGHHRVTIDPAADNARAIRVYEKAGFKPVGVMRSYERGIDGEWHDALLMDLLAEEFESA